MLPLLLVALAGCAGRGPTPAPEPIVVDYTTFTQTLQTDDLTGALALRLVIGEEAAPEVTARMALAGAGAEEGFVATSDAEGMLRIGNAPGGDYELFFSGPLILSDVIQVTVTARRITTDTVELEPAPE